VKTKIIAAAVAAATLLSVAAPTAADAAPSPYRHNTVSVTNGAKWKPASARRCFRIWNSRTGTHRSRVKCHGKKPGTVFRGGPVGRASSTSRPAPYFRG
jgi:uncharacterized low-complexity protein